MYGDVLEDPLKYLRGLISRAVATQTWLDKATHGTILRDTLDLSDLFHPDTFLNAFRQHTVRYCQFIVEFCAFLAHLTLKTMSAFTIA